jgi:hypothetical protein
VGSIQQRRWLAVDALALTMPSSSKRNTKMVEDSIQRGESETSPATAPVRAPKLLERVRDVIRAKHYSRRIESAYVDWIRRYIVFHRKRHPSDMGASEIAAFLIWPATDRRVSASTQNQALSAVLFLYRDVLHLEIGPIENVPRARMPVRVPVVLSHAEVARTMKHLDGVAWIIVARSCTALACGCRNAWSCASRTSISNDGRS